ELARFSETRVQDGHPPAESRDSRPGCLTSILRGLTARGHLYEARFEPRQRLDEITLSGHHLIDVLVGHRHFVKASRQQRDASLAQELLGDIPGEHLLRLRTTHPTAGAVR